MPIHGQKLKFPLWIWGIAAILLLTVSCRRTPKQQAPRLPVIYVNTDKEIPWDKRIPCSVTVVTDGDSTVWGGKVKFRGGTSSKYYKHSYSIKLAEAHTLCGLPANRSWILNASYIDKTLMRHKLCYDLFHIMDSNNLAPKCRYALVRENGNPQGLYVVMERLNKTSLHVDPDDTAAVIFKEPKIFYRDGQLPDPALFGDNYQEQTYPDFEKGDRSYLMDDFRRFLTHTPDPEFYAQIGNWIDMHNLIDWHLLLLFTNGGDGVKKNFYLYRQNSQTPYRIALWDCDHSFGRDGDNEKNMLERLLDDKQNILLDRMLKNKEYNDALAKRYRELRKSGVFSYQTIEKMMQENDQWVRLGLEENIRLWPYDSENYYDAANYDEEYALILEFVPLSLKRLDDLFGYHD